MDPASFRLRHLLGAVYRFGNLVYSSDGTKLFAPVGNRVTIYDLVKNETLTLGFENRKNIRCIALSPDDTVLVSADEDGHIVVSLAGGNGAVLGEMSLNSACQYICFSPDSTKIAVACGRRVTIWDVPSRSSGIRPQFRPLRLRRHVIGSDFGDVTHVEWAEHAPMIACSSEDQCIRVIFVGPRPLLRSHLAQSLSNEDDNSDEDSLEEEDDDDDEGEEFFSNEEPDVDIDKVQLTLPDPKSVQGARVIRSMRLAGHKDRVIASFFSASDTRLYSVSRDGAVFVWELEAQDPKRPWKRIDRFFFQQSPAKVTCAAFNREHSLLAAGFTSGSFSLYRLRDEEAEGILAAEDGTVLEGNTFVLVHRLAISGGVHVNSVALNRSGEWIAFGSAMQGQLLVWEWQSETYILKQQSHKADIVTSVYSPDGSILATGSVDGKVKVWDARSGQCFVTFGDGRKNEDGEGPSDDHPRAAVSDLTFTSSRALVVGYLDGTVRAFDLTRYRMFRKMSLPVETAASVTSVDIEIGGDIVAAGSNDPFEIALFSLQTGKVLEVLAGHEGPISCVRFSPVGDGHLCSTSWDHTVRIWDVFATGDGVKDTGVRRGATEEFDAGSDVLFCCWKLDGRQLAVSTVNGNIFLLRPEDMMSELVIEGSRDISGGRRSHDAQTSRNSPYGKYFNRLAYSTDGSCLFGVGDSHYVCAYDTKHGVLLRKIALTQNRSLDGILHKLNSKNILEDGTVKQATVKTPASSSSLVHRRVQRAARAASVSISPTGAEFSVAWTEGVSIFSSKNDLIFHPFALSTSVTGDHVRICVRNGQYAEALVTALQLNEEPLIRSVYHVIPFDEKHIVIRAIPHALVPRFLEYIAEELETSPRVEFHLAWVNALLSVHGPVLNSERLHSFTSSVYTQKSLESLARKRGGAAITSGGLMDSLATSVRRVLTSVLKLYHGLNPICMSNLSSIEYLLTSNDASKRSALGSCVLESDVPSSLSAAISSKSIPEGKEIGEMVEEDDFDSGWICPSGNELHPTDDFDDHHNHEDELVLPTLSVSSMKNDKQESGGSKKRRKIVRKKK